MSNTRTSSSDPLVLIHKSFGNFLLDDARAKDYYIDPEEWYRVAFRDAFSIGCNAVRMSLNPGKYTMQSSAEGLYIINPHLHRNKPNDLHTTY